METWVGPLMALFGVLLMIANSILLWLVNQVVKMNRELGERKTFSEAGWAEFNSRLERIENKLWNSHSE